MKTARQLALLTPLVAALSFVPAAAQLATQADAAVQRAAAAQRQPLLDTLKEFVSIETGSRDIEGLTRASELLATSTPQGHLLLTVASASQSGVALDSSGCSHA